MSNVQLVPYSSSTRLRLVLDRYQRNRTLFGGLDTVVGFLSSAPTVTLSAAMGQWLSAEVIDLNGRGLVWETSLHHPRNVSVAGQSLSIADGAVSDDGEVKGIINRVRAEYSSGLTGWVENSNSISRYGTHEVVITETKDLSLTEAEARRDALLEYATPDERPVSSVARGSTAELQLSIVGWLYTARWVVADVAAETRVDDWISALIGKCEFLTTGAIATNATAVSEVSAANNHGSVYAALRELLGYGDGSGRRMRLWVDDDPQHTVHYQPLITTPRYYQRGDKIFDRQGSRPIDDPRRLEAGWYRNSNTGRDTLFGDVGARVDGDGALQPTFGLGRHNTAAKQ